MLWLTALAEAPVTALPCHHTLHSCTTRAWLLPERSHEWFLSTPVHCRMWKLVIDSYSDCMLGRSSFHRARAFALHAIFWWSPVHGAMWWLVPEEGMLGPSDLLRAWVLAHTWVLLFYSFTFSNVTNHPSFVLKKARSGVWILYGLGHCNPCHFLVESSALHDLVTSRWWMEAWSLVAR